MVVLLGHSNRHSSAHVHGVSLLLIQTQGEGREGNRSGTGQQGICADTVDVH
jgi:hypothetical protein